MRDIRYTASCAQAYINAPVAMDDAESADRCGSNKLAPLPDLPVCRIPNLALRSWPATAAVCHTPHATLKTCDRVTTKCAQHVSSYTCCSHRARQGKYGILCLRSHKLYKLGD